MMRIWLFTNMPSPYQVEFFNAIQASGRAQLCVRFMEPGFRDAAGDPTAEARFDHKVLFGIGPRIGQKNLKLHPRALAEVLLGRHDYFILSGENTSPTLLTCAVLLWLRRRRWAIWTERVWSEDYQPQWAQQASAIRGDCVRPRRGWAVRVRRLVLRALMGMATRVLCVGDSAIECYRALGVPAEKLALLPYTCDVTRYESVDAARAAEIRQRLALEGKLCYLFSGGLLARKGVDALLSAFSSLARERDDVALVLLGDGPLRRELEESVPLAIRDRVHFVGYRDQTELPAWFRAADVFVFPSRYDGWAVVLNEACGAGLPIITTNMVGAAAHLVAEGQSGFVIAVDDVTALAEKMRYFAENPEQAKRFGARSRELVAQFTPERGVELLLGALGGPA